MKSAACGILWLVSISVHAADEGTWSRFRGPNGDGTADAPNIPAKWTAEDIAWRIDLPGVGHSSPAVWNDKVIVVSGREEDGTRIVQCLDAVSGGERWARRVSAGDHRKHQHNSFASSTPVVDEAQVYTVWGTPGETVVLALTHDGDESWRVDLGPYRSGHGFGVSPMLYREMIVLPMEQQGDSYRVALDRRTGATIWRVPCESSLHYATPCVRRGADGADELIFTNWEQGISAVDPANGEVTWSADVFDKSHIESSISSPVIAGDLVLGVCGWMGHGYELVAVSGASAQSAWRLTTGAPLCCTPLVLGDRIIVWSDQGIVTCVERDSGKVVWRERIGGSYYSSPVSTGRAIYNVSREGEVVMLALGDEFEELGRYDLGEGSHATPAIAGGVMYVRTFTQLVAIGGIRD